MGRPSPSAARYHRGGIHVEESLEDGRLDLSLWPSRIYALPVVLFTALWLRFLWRWYLLVTLAAGASARGVLGLCGLPFLLAGVSLIGTSLRLVLGRTHLELDALRLQVADVSAFGTRAISIALPSATIAAFAAESASRFDDDRELDSWHVCALLHEGEAVTLPLPVRTMREAELVSRRLQSALSAVRAPTGYRS